MKNPLFAVVVVATTAALLGFSGLIGSIAHPRGATSQDIAWSR